MGTSRRSGSGVLAKVAIGFGIAIAAVLLLASILWGLLWNAESHQGEGSARDSASVNGLLAYDEAMSCFQNKVDASGPHVDENVVVDAMSACTDGSFYSSLPGQAEPRLNTHNSLNVVMSSEVSGGKVTFVVDTVGYGESSGSMNSTNESQALMCWTIDFDIAARVIVRADNADCDPKVVDRYGSAHKTTIPEVRRARQPVAGDIKAGTSGTITAVGVGDGGIVKGGAVVATIDGVTMHAYRAVRPIVVDDENKDFDVYGTHPMASLQVMLRDLGYYTDAIDGVFGPNTAAALEAFNSDNGLTKDLDTISPATLVWIGPGYYSIGDVQVTVGDKVRNGDVLVEGSSAWWAATER